MPHELWPLGVRVMHNAHQYQQEQRIECDKAAGGLMTDITGILSAKGLAAAALADVSPYAEADPALLMKRLSVISDRNLGCYDDRKLRLCEAGASGQLYYTQKHEQLSAGVQTALQAARRSTWLCALSRAAAQSACSQRPDYCCETVSQHLPDIARHHRIEV